VRHGLAVPAVRRGSAQPDAKNLGRTWAKDNLNGFAKLGVTSGCMFQQAAEAAVVKKDCKDGRTRSNMLGRHAVRLPCPRTSRSSS